MGTRHLTAVQIVTIPLHGANSTQAGQIAWLKKHKGTTSQSPYTGRTQLKSTTERSPATRRTNTRLVTIPLHGANSTQVDTVIVTRHAGQISHNPLTRGELNSSRLNGEQR